VEKEKDTVKGRGRRVGKKCFVMMLMMLMMVVVLVVVVVVILVVRIKMKENMTIKKHDYNDRCAKINTCNKPLDCLRKLRRHKPP
jgi:uncharacterized membrane protein